METIDYTKLFDVGEEITLSSDFLSRSYDSGSWQQDCINTQKKYGSLKITKVEPYSIYIKGIRSDWAIGLYDINLYQLDPYKENPEIIYAFIKNQTKNLHTKNLTMPIIDAFNWRETPEGHKFWADVYKGKKVKYPEIKGKKKTLKENQQETIQNNNHEIRLQKQKATIVRGTRPKGSRVCSSKHKASIRSRQISYTACHC